MIEVDIKLKYNRSEYSIINNNDVFIRDYN